MELNIEFEIIRADAPEPVPAMFSLKKSPIAPELGDLLPTPDGVFRVVQRALIPESSTIEIGKHRLTVLCTLLEEDDAE